MIQIELGFDRPVDPERLERAARLTLAVEPILACRFVAHRLAPYWQRAETDDALLFRIAADDADYEAFKREPIRPDHAPRLRICLHDAATAARIVFKVCHHVSDATGTKYIVGIVTRLYRRLAVQPQLKPAARAGDRGIEQILRQIPAQLLPRLYADYQQSRQPAASAVAAQTLTIPAGAATDLQFPSRTLDRSQVAALRRFAKSHDATLNDLLLSAFLRTLAQQSGWDGSRRLSMTSTVDYRRYLPGPPLRAVANLSTTLGGFPDLGHELGEDFAATLQRVHVITQHGKDNYLGVGALLGTLISLGPMRHGLAAGIMQEALRNNLARGGSENGLGNNGPIDVDDVTLDAKPVQAVMLPSPFYPPQFVLDVSGYDGSLTLIMGAFAPQQTAARRFLDAIVQEFAAAADAAHAPA